MARAPQPFRSALADRLMLQSLTPNQAPIHSTGQGLARMGTQLAQALGARNLRDQDQQAGQDRARQLAGALTMGQGVQGPPTAEMAGRQDQLAQMLAGSPGAMDAATQALIGQMMPQTNKAKDRFMVVDGQLVDVSGDQPQPVSGVTKSKAARQAEELGLEPGTKEYEEFLRGQALKSDAAPSAVREFQFFQSLSPEEKQQFITMKRANPFLNLGDVFAQPDPLQPGAVRDQLPVGIAPDRRIDDGRIVTMPAVPGQGARGVAGQPPVAPPPALAEPEVEIPPQPTVPPVAPEAAVPGAVPPVAPQPAPAPGGVGITELPPSPAERRKAQEAEEKKLGREAQTRRAGTTVVQDLGRAIELLPEMAQGEGVVGASARLAKAAIPGTAEYRILQFKESALSNVGLDTLQAMRENSPTGGALGQVPIQQQKRLEQVLGSLELGQSPADIDANIKRIMNIYTDIMFGSAEERARAVAEGKMTPEQSAEIDARYFPLPFDEMGRPTGEGAKAPGEMSDEELRKALGL